MLDMVCVSLAALVASLLTLFSGFGLGTLLMPVVALFFSVELAVAVTAVVHLANNMFKGLLLGRQADRTVLLRFGVPAVLAAFLGAGLLGWLATMTTVVTPLPGSAWQVEPVKLVIGVLILLFVLLELSPGFKQRQLDLRYMPLGGGLSGFFGGLSGHQGAFRSMFLLKAGLSKEAFVGTNIMLAVMVDLARLLVYGSGFLWIEKDRIDWWLVGSASLAAFLGAWLGARLLDKITFSTVQKLVSALLLLIGTGMVAGVL